MILDATTKKVQILLGATVAANQCPVVVDYVDFTSTTTTPGNQLSNTNNVTAVDIVSAPAASTQRKVNLITVCNKDTDFVAVTVRYNDNGTTYNYVGAIQLPPNATLQYTDTGGWSVIDAAGDAQIAPLAVVDVQTFAANGTWTRPANAMCTQVDVVGGGGGGGSRNTTVGGGGGGGGKRLQFIFDTAWLPDTVPVTVGGGGTAGNASDGGVGGTSSFGSYLLGYGGGGGAGGSNNTGGGGGGGSGAGSTGSATGGIGGPAVALSVVATAYADDRGAGAPTATGNAGSTSYLGGGSGGAGNSGANTGGAGGTSMFSGGGGGGGGGSTGTGGAGGATGGAITAASGGGGAANTGGAAGSTLVCGAGGGGGSANTAGGSGGTPGGGGGGAGGHSTTTKLGGVGGDGKVWVVSW